MIADSFSHQATNVPRTICRGNTITESPTLAIHRNQRIILRYMLAVNTTGAMAYLQVFGAIDSQVTVGTTIPVNVIPVPAVGDIEVSVEEMGFLLGDASNGCSIAATTTRGGNVSAPVDVFILFN